MSGGEKDGERGRHALLPSFFLTFMEFCTSIIIGGLFGINCQSEKEYRLHQEKGRGYG